jgi:hypothetical protein
VKYAPTVFAVLLEQDSFFLENSLFSEMKEVIPDLTEGDFNEIFSELDSDGTLVAFDVEEDGLDGVLIDHEDHGSLKSEDLFIIGASIQYSLGAAFPIKLFPIRHEVAEAAFGAGLKEASRLLSLLPIDSSSWTGVQPDFRFDDASKSKVIDLIKSARKYLEGSALSNADHAKADAYLDCALRLAELPEPEPDFIAEFIKRALIVMGLVGWIADLKALFGGS